MNPIILLILSETFILYSYQVKYQVSQQGKQTTPSIIIEQRPVATLTRKTPILNHINQILTTQKERHSQKYDQSRLLALKTKFRQNIQSWARSTFSSDQNNKGPYLHDLLGVSESLVYTKSHPEGVLAIMDTGSSHAVLLISSTVADMNDFRPAQIENFNKLNFQEYYKRLKTCPSYFAPEYRCTSATYVSDGSNSVFGIGSLSFSSSQNEKLTMHMEYSLNNLYGFNFNLAIIGLGFGSGGFKTTPLLSNFYQENGPQNLVFMTTNTHNDENLTSEPVRQNQKLRQLLFNQEFEEQDYFWVLFDKIGMNYTFVSCFGIYMSTEDKPGIAYISDEKVSDMQRLNPFLHGSTTSNHAIFDSGSTGIIMDWNSLSSFIKSFFIVFGSSGVVEKIGPGTYAICWPSHETSKRLDYTPSPKEVTVNILIGGVQLSIPLDGIEQIQFETEDGKSTYNCSLAIADGVGPTIVVGYAFWQGMDVIWDQKGSRMGFRMAQTK